MMDSLNPRDAYRSFFTNLLDNTDQEYEGKEEQLKSVKGQEPRSCHEVPIKSPGAITTAGAPNASSSTSRDDVFSSAVVPIRVGVMGRYKRFRTPYRESMPLVYADWTATGRAVAQIESYLIQEVMPMFGNTHTTTSITGAQTTCFRHEARQIIAQAVNAKVTGRAAEDVVLFTGTGATGAITKLVSALGLGGPLPAGVKTEDRPVVFVGPFEHHSNLLPWRESCAEVVAIGEDASGCIDVAELEGKLRKFAGRRLKIGSFSAASNVTGVLEDVDRVTAVLHRAGALAMWDYATAAPYVRVDMNPVASGMDDKPLVSKDAIFFSGHKFLGGPGTPGVLVVKKRLLCNAVPSVVGGGTVFFVTDDDHRYLSNKEEREEGGTPDILGSIRLGLAVQMKQRLGEDSIELFLPSTASSHYLYAMQHAKRTDLLDKSRFLHYNFVCALLNDLFGVQTRGGCQCAGPYSQRLLGLSMRDTRAVEAELLSKHELLRPGFTRFSLAYVNSDQEAKYILDAILFVADYGADFLPQYRVNYKTGEWKHKTRFTRFPERRWLGHCDYGPSSGPLICGDGASSSSIPAALPGAIGGPQGAGEGVATASLEVPMYDEQEKKMMDEVFEEATRHVLSAKAGSGDARWAGSEDVLGSTGEALRWFPYPWEAVESGSSSPGMEHPEQEPTSRQRGSQTEIRGEERKELSTQDRSRIPTGSHWGCILKPRSYRARQGVGGEGKLSVEGLTDAGGSLTDSSAQCPGTEDEDGSLGGGACVVSSFVEPFRVSGTVHPAGELLIKQAELGGAVSNGKAAMKEEGPQGEVVGNGAVDGMGTDHEDRTDKEDGVDGHRRSDELRRGDDGVDSGQAKIDTQGGEATGGSVKTGNGAVEKEAFTAPAPQLPAGARTDDSYKYPLRTASGGSCASFPPAYLAASTADPDGTLKGNGGANGNKKKLDGYRGHMEALGKLGEASAQSRLFPTPPKKIMKAVGQAIQEWSMIQEGDRLCLGLSGGKDSLTLLHVLLTLQKRAPINFEVACATVDPQTPSFDPSSLIPYMKRLGVKLHYISTPIIEQAKTSMLGDSLCAYCARMKRGALYTCCRENGYNKLVLAQHLDDLAESFVMSALHNGQVRTMKTNYKIEAGDVRVIRPLCYARESFTKEFAQLNHLPVVNENCPACFEEPKERQRVKKMLAKEESLFPSIYSNLRKALVPLMDDDTYGAMKKTSSEVSARQAARRDRGPSTRKRAGAEHSTWERETARPSTEARLGEPPEAIAIGDEADVPQPSTSQGHGLTSAGSPATEDHSTLASLSDAALQKELDRRRSLRKSSAAGLNMGIGDACSLSRSEGSDAGAICVPCFELA